MKGAGFIEPNKNNELHFRKLTQSIFCLNHITIDDFKRIKSLEENSEHGRIQQLCRLATSIMLRKYEYGRVNEITEDTNVFIIDLYNEYMDFRLLPYDLEIDYRADMFLKDGYTEISIHDENCRMFIKVH